MDKQYRPWLPGQPFLLPPSPLDWLPAEHLVHFLFDVLESLDLSEITAAIHAKDARGTRPYNPRMMTALLLYGYCVGLAPMLDEIERNCGRLPERVTGDSGYFSEENARTCEERGVNAHLAVERQKHGTDPAAPAPAPEGEGKRAMRAKLQTPAGRATYARRKAVVEPVFGQIKEARGFRRFLLRGLTRVRAEWALICTGHNLRKLLAALRDRRVGAALPAASPA